MLSNLYKKIRTIKVRAVGNISAGFSLVETIVYMALFIILSTVLLGSLFGMTRAYTEVRVNDDLFDSGQISMQRMMLEARNATGIDSSSVLGSDPGTLVLDALDGSGAPKTVTFSETGGVLQIVDSTDGAARDLTGSKVTVTSLVFLPITTAAGSAVRIEMTLLSDRSPTGKTISLADTAVIRGAY